jgi:spore coat polysaccharide biosynthesis protein SpsF (cytidylyltransferase family)
MIVCIIQARMGSTRLPGKVMMEINKMPMLKFQVERVLQAKMLDEVIVATSTLVEDNEIFELCKDEGIPCFRGSENDVLTRYYDCACKYEAEIVVRVTGDCPFVDPVVIDQSIELFLEAGVDYEVNTAPPETSFWPDGSDVEVFSMEAFKRVHMEAMSPEDREHVTFFFWKNGPNREFSTIQLKNKENWSKYRFTVDYPEDYEVVKRIENELRERQQFGHVEEIVNIIQSRQDIFDLNAKYYFGIGWE